MKIPFTLREMYRILSCKTVLVFYFLIAGVCVVAGPFSTFDNLSTLERFPYWLAIVAGCFVIAIGVQVFFRNQSWFRTCNDVVLIGLFSLLNGVAIAIFIFGVNQLVWGDIPELPRFYHYLLMTIPISLVISTGILFFAGNNGSTNAQKQVAFFERIPVHLGQDLYSVSVNDHYIEAVTAEGSHMILMRLSDAIRELEGFDGIQIHRSHWIATNSVEKVTTKNGKLTLALKDQRSFTVSRSRMAAVKTHLNI